jgi:N4-gp56 family major capsid protein
MTDITATPDVGYDRVAYDLATYFPFYYELYFDRFASVKPTRLSTRGAVVTFNKTNALALADTPIDESVDITATVLSDGDTTVTLNEYGNASKTTAKLRATGMIELDPIVAETIGVNAGQSMDSVAALPFFAGTQVAYGGDATTRLELTVGDKLTAHLVRLAFARLTAASVPRLGGGFYGAILHPDTAIDLKEETTSGGAWRTPREYVDPANLYNGELGEFEGFRFVVSPRARKLANAGSPATVDVYQSALFGGQAIAKGFSNGGGYGMQPVFGLTPVTDNLERFKGMYWKHFTGYSVFRNESLFRIETVSSIGTNT